MKDPVPIFCGEGREWYELLQARIAEVDSRLGKLYDALETGEFYLSSTTVEGEGDKGDGVIFYLR